MIVELIGTPGAGKTTLLPAVIAQAAAQGGRGFTVLEAARPFAQRTRAGAVLGQLGPPRLRRLLLWQLFARLSMAHRLRFGARHPQLIRHVLTTQWRRPIPAVERGHVLSWFFVLTGQYEFLKAQARPDEWLVFDEGFAHRSVQMHASDRETPDPAQVAAYMALLPQPDLLIAVHAPWQTCVERIYRRGLWARFRHKSRAQVERYVANAHQIVILAIAEARRAGWNVIEVDNSGVVPGCHDHGVLVPGPASGLRPPAPLPYERGLC